MFEDPPIGFLDPEPPGVHDHGEQIREPDLCEQLCEAALRVRDHDQGRAVVPQIPGELDHRLDRPPEQIHRGLLLPQPLHQRIDLTDPSPCEQRCHELPPWMADPAVHERVELRPRGRRRGGQVFR